MATNKFGRVIVNVTGARGTITANDKDYFNSKANASLLTFGNIRDFSNPSLQYINGATHLAGSNGWGILVPSGQTGSTSLFQAEFEFKNLISTGEEIIFSFVFDISATFTRFNNFAAFLQVRMSDGSIVNASDASVTSSMDGSSRVITFKYTIATSVVAVLPVVQMLNASPTTVDESITLKEFNLRQDTDANGTQTGTDAAFSFLTKKLIQRAVTESKSNENYTVVTVAPSGGDFNHPKLALDSINDASIVNRYKIAILPGTYTGYAEWHTKDYVDLIGIGRPDQVVISYSNANNASGSIISNTSTFWLDSITIIENLTVQITNGRYAVHRESNGVRSGIYNSIINCVIEHLGNSSATNGASWPIPSQYGVGAGNSPGEKWTDRGSVFRGPGAGFSYHNPNAGAYSVGTFVDLEGCVFEATETGYPDLFVKIVRPGAGDILRLVGNTLNTLKYYDGEWQIPSDTTSDRACISVYGFANTPFNFDNNIVGGAPSGGMYQPRLTGL